MEMILLKPKVRGIKSWLENKTFEVIATKRDSSVNCCRSALGKNIISSGKTLNMLRLLNAN